MKTIKLILIVCITVILRADYPDYSVTIYEEPYPANLFIHSMSSSNPHMAIFNSDLTLNWEVNSGELGMDFKPNNTKLTYFYKSSQYWIITDTLMNEIDTIRCAHNKRTDYHDIKLLDNGGYILQCYDSTWVDVDPPGGTPQLIKDILIIQEFNNQDSLIFEWNAFDFLSIYDYPDLNLYNPIITFMHGNSIEIDYDENLLISNRSSNEIFKLDRNSGDIIWIMGGPQNEFDFIDDPLGGFNKQHDVRRIENGNITLFDNGTQHQPMLSRAVEYDVDEINKTATLVWDYVHPDSIVAMSMGSVQRLPNNNTLINWGFFFETNILNTGSLITEIDYDKNTVFELSYPVGYYTYKVRKGDWDFSINVTPGDTNLDEIINILDIVYLVNYILYDASSNGHRPNLFNLHKIDLNTDGEINILDALILIDIIIN